MKETVEIETEDQSGNAESSDLLSETCFHLQTHEAEVDDPSTSRLQTVHNICDRAGNVPLFENAYG